MYVASLRCLAKQRCYRLDCAWITDLDGDLLLGTGLDRPVGTARRGAVHSRHWQLGLDAAEHTLTRLSHSCDNVSSERASTPADRMGVSGMSLHARLSKWTAFWESTQNRGYL